MPPKRKTWSTESMIAAVEAVKLKRMGYLRASKEYNVPKSTLKDYVKNKNKNVEQMISSRLGRKPTFPMNIEEQLVAYCLEMDKRFYGLTALDIRKLAFQLAIRNKIPCPFPRDKGAAGKKWLRKFLQRHPNLAFRKPQGISSARVKGFTKENVQKFFDILEPALAKIKNNPSRVYNVDETGVTQVQSKHSRVISLKGKRQVGAITAAERGSLVTIVICMNASGGFVPPMMVFPRKNMKAELLDGAPPGTIAGCHPSGWIQQHLFTQWLHHFISHVKPSREDPVVLILDGHYSHTRNLDVIELARRNNVIIICLPPHSTHKMQPLDLEFMGPLKTYYSQEIETWQKNHVGRNVTAYQIAELLGKSYLKAATGEISANGFRKSGIYPCNRHSFQDWEFAIHSHEETSPIQSPSNETIRPFTPTVSPDKISPLPSCSGARKVKSRGGTAKLITGTPYKDELEASMAEAQRKNSVKKRETKTTANKKGQSKIIANKKGPKRVLLIESDSDGSISLEMEFSDHLDNDDDAECIYCAGHFSDDKNGEKWIQCTKCYRWGHEECANSKYKKNYICYFCIES